MVILWIALYEVAGLLSYVATFMIWLYAMSLKGHNLDVLLDILDKESDQPRWMDCLGYAFAFVAWPIKIVIDRCVVLTEIEELYLERTKQWEES